MTFALVLMFATVFSLPALANPACAVCTVAVGASLEIARHFGVDDSVVGVWAGAMLVMIGFWTIKWFDAKGWVFKGRDWLIQIISVAMIGFVYISEIPYNAQVIGIFYIDPFLFSRKFFISRHFQKLSRLLLRELHFLPAKPQPVSDLHQKSCRRHRLLLPFP